MSITPKDVITAILDGQLDDSESRIYDAFKERRRQKSARKVAAFSVGDTVKFHGANPAYLNGLKAEVKKVNQTTVGVEIIPEDKPLARRFAHGPIRVPADMLEAA